MSTELKQLKASIGLPRKDKSMTSDYLPVNVNLTRFYGGAKRGVSLQIGFLDENAEYKHIQLDSENIKQLKDMLNEEFPEES